jgi:hypothetical protein
VAIVRVQTGTAATTTGTGTITPTLPAGATAGNVIVAFLATNTPTTPPTVNSGGGATKQVENSTGNACGTAIFTKVAAGGETNIGAFTCSTGTRDMYGILLEYSGLSGITAEQTQNGGSATGATVVPTGVTASSSTAPSLVLGLEVEINALQAATVARAAGDASTGGTVTKIGEAASGAATAAQRVCARVSEVITTGSGVVGHQATITTARAWSAAIASFQEAAAGGAPVFPSFVTPDMSLYPS